MCTCMSVWVCVCSIVFASPLLTPNPTPTNREAHFLSWFPLLWSDLRCSSEETVHMTLLHGDTCQSVSSCHCPKFWARTRLKDQMVHLTPHTFSLLGLNLFWFCFVETLLSPQAALWLGHSSHWGFLSFSVGGWFKWDCNFPPRSMNRRSCGSHDGVRLRVDLRQCQWEEKLWCWAAGVVLVTPELSSSGSSCVRCR